MVANHAVGGAARRSLFLFSGQGAHWSGMAESLLKVHDGLYPVLCLLDDFAAARLEQRPSSVLLFDQTDLRDRADYSWPIQTAMQLALVDLWKKLGLVPDMVAGHSIGEIAAAYAIGAITRETALQISLVLGRWAASRDGSMAVVDLGWDMSEALLNIPVPNCRRVIEQDDGHTVLSGPRQEMVLIQEQCLERAIAFRPVKAAGMVHCPIASEERTALMAELGTIELHRASTPFYSGLAGGAVPAAGLTAEHWTRCVTEPVYWRQALAAVLQVGLSDVVEISAHPLLLHSVKLSSSQPTGLVLPSLVRGRPAGATIGDAAAQLQDHGHPVIWEASARPGSDASDALGSASQVFVVSGKSKAALAAQIRRMSEFVEQNALERLEDLCFTAAVHRMHHPFRRAIISSTLDDLRRGLRALETADADPANYVGSAEPLPNVYFGSSLAASDAFISRLMRAPEFAWHWSRSDHVLADVHRTIGRGDGAADTECLTMRLQLAIWATMQSWGVAAADFSGSGVGALAAACASGAMSLRVAFETICRGGSMPNERRDTGATGAPPQLVLGDDVDGVLSARSTANVRVSEVAVEGPELWPHLLSRLYEIGISVQWRRVFSPRCEIVNLPTYAWQREQYWPTERKGQPKQMTDKTPPGPVGIYKFDWFPADIPSTRVPPGAWGRTIIFAPADIAEFVRAALATNAVWVTPGDRFEQLSATEMTIDPRHLQDFARVLDLAGTSSCRVLYLWGMKAASASTTAVDAMLDGAINLTDAILARSPGQFEVSVVTAGLHQASGGQADTPMQALVWGMFRSFRLEVPQLRQRLVDIAVPDLMSTNGTFVAQLKAVLDSSADHAESAWRGDREFLPVLTLAPPDVRASWTVGGGDRATEVHLVTGGTGALGLKVAQRLVASGVNRVALMSRSQPGPRARSVATELRRAGAEIVFVSADADQKDELSRAISVVEATIGPISHVVHAAGVLRAAPLDSLDSQVFWRASAGKISALSNIEALLDLKRVRLVIISSVAAIFGLSRHSPYAAANAYIDAFAVDRRRKGLNVRSIALGPLADSDMLMRSHGKSNFPGLPAMAIDDALDRLDILSSDDIADRIVMIFDHDVWRSLGVAVPGLAISDDVPAAREQRKASALPPSPSSLAQALAAVLTRDVGSSEWDMPFSELGLNSMMGMDLRDRIRSQFGADIPVSALYNFPTVNSLARLLLVSSSGSPKSHIVQPKYSPPADAIVESKSIAKPIPDTYISLETMILDELRSLGYR